MNVLNSGPASYKPIGLPAKEYTQGGPQRDRDMELGDIGADIFFDEVASVREKMRNFEASITTLSTKHVYSLSQPSPELSGQIDGLTKQLQSQSSAVTQRIAALGGKVGLDEAKRGHFENLKAGMQRNVAKFQQVEMAQRGRIRDRLERQYKIVKPEATDAEIKNAIENNQADQIFAQAHVGSRLQGAQEALNEASIRRAEVQKIEQTLVELAQLFQQVAELVAVQDTQIISIEDTALHVEKDMDDGVKQLTTARISAAAARHKRKLCAGFAAVILFVIIIVIIIEVKSSGGGGGSSSTKTVTSTGTTSTKTSTTTSSATSSVITSSHSARF